MGQMSSLTPNGSLVEDERVVHTNMHQLVHDVYNHKSDDPMLCEPTPNINPKLL